MTLLRLAAFGPRIAAFAFLALVASASQAQGRYTISSDGQEVTDTTTKLAWRRCAEGLRWDGKECTGKLKTFKYGEAKDAAAAAANATLIDLSDAICPGDPCQAVVRDMIVQRDDHHLTATFAVSLAPQLEAALPIPR